MPTNCKGQDKPGQSRGYRAARDTDRGARGSPGRRGHGAGRGLRCCLHPAPHCPPNPACPQAASTEPQPKPGTPAADGASTSPRFAAAYACVGVTGSGSRMAAMTRAGGGKAWPWPSRVWPLREGSCKTCLGVQTRLSCPPSTVPRRPDPEGTAAVPFHSPRTWGPLASTLSWSPNTAERTIPEAPGAGEPRAAGTTGMLMAFPADA